MSAPRWFGGTLVLLLALFAASSWAAATSAARSPEGHWQGTIQGAVRVVVHVDRSAAGQLTGKLDSPDQGAFGLAIDTLVFATDSLRFTMRRILADFAGVMSADGGKIEGRWRQGGATMPLTLERLAQAPELKRPQEPHKPYPYAEDTVRVENRRAGLSLAGTLTAPRGNGPFPCVVLITGSGPEDRDEAVFGHRPFLVLADHLTRSGIAVLRMDDRGVGGSSGEFSAATSEDFASDVAAALEFLKTRKGIDARHIGLIGHSEGGLIAPMVAARSKDVAFVVLLAGPGVPGDSVLTLQVELATRAAGADEATVAAQTRLQSRILTILRSAGDSAAVTAQVRQVFRDMVAELPEASRSAVGDPDAVADEQLERLRTPWMRFFLRYDPRPALRQLSCPVLALNGEKDVQVAPKQNLGAIEAALKAGGNRDFTVKELPGLNHLFQRATSGAIEEYAKIEETMAPLALDEVTRWVQSRGSSKR